jgi:hypothetical protein
MEFNETELLAIERACRVQAHNDRQLAENTDRAAIKNQRLDCARELLAIVGQIEEDRRRRALAAKRCDHCDD